MSLSFKSFLNSYMFVAETPKLYQPRSLLNTSKLKLLSHLVFSFSKKLLVFPEKKEEMDQYENHKQQSLTQLMNSQFLKKFTQLLVSVSVFSFFFSRQTLLSLPQSSNFHFSTFPYQLFSHTLDKNYIFLLCNGLLVFLAKYSGLTRCLSGSNNNDESFKSQEDGLRSEPLISETKEAMLDKEVLVESRGSGEDVVMEQGSQMDYFIKEDEKETEESVLQGGEGESRLSISEEEEEGEGEGEEEEEREEFFLEDEKEEKESDSVSFIEEEEEDGNGTLSTEELNKKFDDFIRRMKAEIRIEAQQQLVMVQ